MMAFNLILIWLIDILVCLSLASPLNVRNSDALVQTVHHFSNDTVSDCVIFFYNGT